MGDRNYNRRYAKEYGLRMKLCYFSFLYFVVAIVGKLFYNLKIEGRENLEKGKRYVYAPNHVSYLDPPFTGLAVNRKMAFMAKHELFHDKNIFIRFIVKNMGAFAVDRENPEIATFKTVFEILKTNWSLGICPQGTIQKTGEISVIQKGFTAIAKKAKFDIVPIGICGFSGYSLKLFGHNMSVKIGKPISYKLDSDEIIRQWLEQICEMTGYENKVNIQQAKEKVSQPV